MANKRGPLPNTKVVSQEKSEPLPSHSHRGIILARLVFIVIVPWVVWKQMNLGRVLIDPSTFQYKVPDQMPPKSQQMSVTFEIDGIKAMRGYSGWSPHNDANPAKDRAISGNPLEVKGTLYQQGIGTHAPSEIVFDLEGKVKRFNCLAAVDQGAGSSGRVIFTVKADGKKLIKTPVLTCSDDPVSIDLNMEGVKDLSLICEGDKNNGWCHGDWLNLKFTK